MEFQLIISGGEVVDGSAAAVPVRADVGVADGRIAAVGDLSERAAPVRIDATSLTVTPGFIDAHVHSEHALIHGQDVDRFGSLIQGVTTHALGADGFGWQPGSSEAGTRSLWRSTVFAYGSRDHLPEGPDPAGYLRAFEGRTPLNVVPFAPHQAIRHAALGWTSGPADATAMALQVRALRDWLDAGAFGLSTGLDYQPAASTRTDEIVALARIVADADGVYAPHQRYAQAGREQAYRESIEIGRRAGLPVTIAHETIDEVSRPLIDAARADGVDVTIDWYCYPAGCTHLLAMLQPEDYEGGTDGALERVKDPGERARFAAAFQAALAHPETSEAFDGPEPEARAYFSATRTGRHIGRSIGEIAAEAGVTPGEMAVRLLEQELPDAVMVYRRGVAKEDFDEQVRRTITHPAWTLTSDGLYHGPLPHPRGYGAYARFLRYAVRELRALTFPQAVHRASGGVADRLRLRDRGHVREGLAADLVVLDREAVAETNDWDHPRRPPVGIQAVVVNGTLAVRDGRPTGALAGRVLRRA